MRKFNINENFNVIDCGGKEKLLDEITGRIVSSTIKTLGIIIDADTDISST